MNRLRKFCRLKWKEKLLFCESLFLNLYVGALLKVIPFRWIPRLFRSPQFAVGTLQPEVVENVKVAVRQAGWISPWKNRCLVSSLTARYMLRRRRISSELYLGMAKNEAGRMIAHAWLVSCSTEIVEKNGQFISLYTL